MSRKLIQLQIISLEKKITALEKRSLEACYASATGNPHEDMWKLFMQKDLLVVRKLELEQKLVKRTIIQIIKGGEKK